MVSDCFTHFSYFSNSLVATWKGRRGDSFWDPSETPSPNKVFGDPRQGVCPHCSSVRYNPHTPSLPPGCSWPWLEFSAPLPAAGHSPDGVSLIPVVPSRASSSSSAWGQCRVHHVRRASWRDGKHGLTQLPLEESPAVEEEAPLPRGPSEEQGVWATTSGLGVRRLRALLPIL